MAAFLLFLSLFFAGAHGGLDPNGVSADAHMGLDPDGAAADAHMGLDPNG
jgi:hypothetical protein